MSTRIRTNQKSTISRARNVAGQYANSELVRGVGVASPSGSARNPRVTRAGASTRAGRGTWADVTVRDAHVPPEVLRQLGTVGTGFDDLGQPVLTSRGNATVRVSRPGQPATFVPASAYARERRQARTTRRLAASQRGFGPEVARMAQSRHEGAHRLAVAEGTA